MTPWLFDRYPHTLLKLGKFDRALDQVDDAEAWCTKGMIESRAGRVGNAVRNLDKASSLGRACHLCELQTVYTYVSTSPPRLNKARECLAIAQRAAPRDKILDRFTTETLAFQRRWFS